MANVKARVDEILPTIDFSKTKYELELQTTEGNIELEFFPDLAPNHCKNLISLAKIGFYDGVIFHRVISGFMIQGGCPDGTGMGGPGYTIDQEFNESPHIPEVMSMARTPNPNSAGSQFFICLEKVPYLDRQYTVFGKTKDDASLAVVKAIGATATGANDRPRKDIIINKAVVKELQL